MLKLSSCSSTWFNPCSGRGKCPFVVNKVEVNGRKVSEGLSSGCSRIYRAARAEDENKTCLQEAQACVLSPPCDPMDCSPPGSSVHRISWARILEWVAISFSRGSSQPRGQTHVSFVPCVSCICRQILYHLSHQGSRKALNPVYFKGAS